MQRLLAVLIGVLTLLPSVQAADLELQGRPQLKAQVGITDTPIPVEFRTDFHANATGQGYLKALPSAGNPVFLNGTPDAGWWTHAVLEQEGVLIGEAGTNGTSIATLGPLETGQNYTLRLTVNVPAEALQEPGELKLAYALAVKLESNGSGSGGSLDPSVSVLPRIHVMEAEPEGQGAASGVAIPWDPQWVLPIGLVAAVGILAGVRTVARRRSGASGAGVESESREAADDER